MLLVHKEAKMTLRELAQKAGLSIGMASKIIKALEATGHIRQQRGILVVHRERLLKSWAYTVSVNEYEKIEFMGAERAPFLIQKVSQLLKNEPYALTLFSATEIVAPYVAPDKVHLYLLKGNEKKVSSLFLKEGIIPAEKGNIVCYLVDQHHFYGQQKIRGVKVISFPQLYVDLLSYGGRGEEAAEQVLKVMNSV